MVPPAAAAALQAGSMPNRAVSARSSSVAGGVLTIRTASDTRPDSGTAFRVPAALAGRLTGAPCACAARLRRPRSAFR